MAVHDGAAHLAEAVESILGQDLRDLELVVVEDASTDETPALLAGYGDARLVVVRNDENLGLTRSLNRGLELARGEYVARQDADDRSLPGRLARQAAFLDARPEVAVCGAWARYVDDGGRRVGAARPPGEHDEIARLLPLGNQFVHGSLMLRRAALGELGGYREAFRYAQDYDLTLRALDRFRLANVEEELYELRFHRESLTIRQRELQHAYGLLARRLWRERREEGRDSLETGRDPEELLAEVTAGDGRAELLSYQALYAWLAGDLRGYRRALLGLVRAQPRQYRHYVRFLLSFGGRRFSEGAQRAWRARPRRRS